MLEIDGKKIAESLDISKYLEEQFPEPSAFNTKCNIGKCAVMRRSCSGPAYCAFCICIQQYVFLQRCTALYTYMLTECTYFWVQSVLTWYHSEMCCFLAGNVGVDFIQHW